MTLGELLAASRDPARIEAWLAACPSALCASVDEEAGALGLSAGDYLRQVVAAFTTAASPDSWTQLLGRLARSDDPGRACVEAMQAWHRQARAAHAHHPNEDARHGSHA